MIQHMFGVDWVVLADWVKIQDRFYKKKKKLI